jgi:aryl-alcohol dehydrogenase-like predicted oxidoreductase
MEYRKLGTSDLKVSAIGFGAWGIAGGAMWGDQDERDSIAALHAALDGGITFFDTAEGYGAGYSEEVVGRAFRDRRDKLLIATKVSPSNLAPSDLRASCESSLARLQTDHVDLYQIHWPKPPGNADEIVETLTRLRNEGKFRYAGVSNFGPVDLARYPDGLFVSNQVAYSLAFRAIEYELVGASAKRGMSIIAYSALLHGILSGRYASADEVQEGRARTRHFSSERESVRHGEAGHEDALFALIAEAEKIAEEAGLTLREAALLWVLSREGVATVLAGSRTAEQAASNAALGAKSLPAEAASRLTAASEALKTAMGPNPDMWQTQSRIGYTLA